MKSYKNKIKNGRFFKEYNEFIDKIWKTDENLELYKLEIGSTAIRYFA